MTHKYSPTTLSHLVLAEGVPLVDAIAQLPQIDSEQRQIEAAALTSAKVLSAGCIVGGLGLFAASAVPLAGFSAGVGALAWAAAGLMGKPGNKRSRDGEQYLINASEIRNWIVMAWQAGYPIGQILAGYNAYCEAVGGEMQFKRPEIGSSGEDFVHCLNHSPDAISKLPPVVKVGSTTQLKARTPSKTVPKIEVKETMPLPDNAIPLAPPEVIAKYEAFKAKQAQSQPSPVQTLERTYQQAVAEEQRIDEFQHLATTALEYLQANPFISRSWYGGQRTGKSYGAAQVSKWMHDNLGTKVYYINLFSYAPSTGQREDDTYWGHAEKKYYADWRRLPSADAAEIAIAKAYEVFEAFNLGPENAVLIVDEWASTGAKAARFQSLLERLTSEVSSLCTNLDSSGVKQRQAVWLISPKMVAGALTDSGKILKHLPMACAAITEGQSVDWQGNGIRFDGELHEQLCNNYAKFPAPKYDAKYPRKVYLGGTWYAPGW